jgi:hypothetical protein
MPGRWAAMAAALLVAGACTHGSSPPVLASPAAGSEAPPPRGQPPPRLGHLPQPPPGPGDQAPDSDEQQQRFPILQGEARKESAQRQAAQVPGRVELAGSAHLAEICDGVSAQDRVSCPLRPGAVARVADIPNGVRIELRRRSTSPETLGRALACQRDLALASPRELPLCPFLDAHTAATVVTRQGQVTVELTRTADVDPLREQVRGFVKRR